MSQTSRAIFPGKRPLDTGFDRFAIVVVLLLTGLRVAALFFNRTDLFVDESQYWSWSRALDWGYYSKPPLIAVIIAATTQIFGDQEWAVRLASPLFHGGTAMLLAAIGQRLYGGRAGGWAALVYIMLPAVSLSSTLISTDPPLLFFWSLALFALVRFLERNDWTSALLYGAAIAIGANAKYAMLFLVPLAPLALLSSPDLRGGLKSVKFWIGTLFSFVGLVPNAIWNARHGFATLRHTSDNAHWTGSLFHPGSMAEFLGAQAGVFGPVLLVLLVLALVGRVHGSVRQADRFLLILSVPIILIFTGQALISRANANWAATAYPAASVLVAGILDQWNFQRWRRISAALHGFVAAVLLVTPAFAPELPSYHLGNPFARILGIHRAMVDIAEAAGPAKTLIFVRRADTAAALYYLRDKPFRIRSLMDPSGVPQDHFQMSRPFTTADPSSGLLISSGTPALSPSMRADATGTEVPVAPGVSEDGKLTLTPVFW